MREVANETAYFINPKLPVLVLIAQGVRFPEGHWLRVADGGVVPWQVEEFVVDLFPALRNRPVPFHALLTDFDLTEYERGAAASS
jgi:hypothetical protein